MKAKKARVAVVDAKIGNGKRKRGRPAVHENGVLDAKLIIACAFELSKTTPLQDLSIVRVARELGVTPALIHYYLDGRDALTSGIMNSFYREMLSEWPPLTGQWRDDLLAAAWRVYNTYVRYAGVAAYVVAHNRFRMVQIVAKNETDFGLLFFERFVGVIREIGFDAQRTAMYAALFMELIISGAYATVRHRWPGDHSDFLDRAFVKLDPEQFPNTHFIRKNHVQLASTSAFEAGMYLTLSGLDLERSKLSHSGGGVDSRAMTDKPAATRKRKS